jgi:hypothetical protein
MLCNRRGEVTDSPRRAEGGPHARNVEDQDRCTGRRWRRSLRPGTHRSSCLLLGSTPPDSGVMCGPSSKPSCGQPSSSTTCSPTSPPDPRRRPQVSGSDGLPGPESSGRRRAAASEHYLEHADGGMSGNSVQLCDWLTYAGRAGQPGGKGWIRLSPRGVQEGQEVDPVQPPARNPQRGRSGDLCTACAASVADSWGVAPRWSLRAEKEASS